MSYHNPKQFRAINRRGLFNPDGDILPLHVIRAAYHNSAPCIDVCHVCVRDMMSSMCNGMMVRMIREFDLVNNVWFTRVYDECGRYADDIIHDWLTFGIGTYTSLHDVVSMYINEIIACPKPERVFDSTDDFVFTHKHGRIPKTLHNPARPPQYKIGEGHRNIPDGVGHPLLNQSYVPSGLTPYDKNYDTIQPPRLYGPRRVERITQTAKGKDITRFVHDMQPEAAYMLESGGAHHVLLYGCIDASTVFKRAEHIQKQHNTPVNCIVLEKNTLLLYDTAGNDAKHIIQNGTRIMGSLEVYGDITPPRPAAIPNNDLLVNLDRHGFTICVHDPIHSDVQYRPEYVIAASFFTNEPRWYLSGTAVLLCRAKIDWGLLLYLAGVYGFTRTLYGILRGLAEEGYTFEYPLSALREYNTVKIELSLRETLRVYGLALTT